MEEQGHHGGLPLPHLLDHGTKPYSSFRMPMCEGRVSSSNTIRLTCGVLCLLYFQNFPWARSCASRSLRASRSGGGSCMRSRLRASRELVSRRTYLASLSSSGTFLDKRSRQLKGPCPLPVPYSSTHTGMLHSSLIKTLLGHTRLYQ